MTTLKSIALNNAFKVVLKKNMALEFSSRNSCLQQKYLLRNKFFFVHALGISTHLATAFVKILTKPTYKGDTLQILGWRADVACAEYSLMLAEESKLL